MARRTKQNETEPQARDPDGLTDRQLAFIDHYLGDCKLNAAKAAKAAGYSVRQSAPELMSNPVIRARIDDHLARLAKTRDEVLEMLVDDALVEPDEVLKRRDVKALDPVTRSSYVSGLISARTSARQSLAKAYGLFSDRQGAGAAISIEINGVDIDKV